MANAVFSPKAETDLFGIGEYTLSTWGSAQADRYLTGIADFCDRIAGNPYLGRSCDNVQPGLRRIEHGEHVIFYRPHADGITVSRVLHRSMSATRHSMDEG